MVLNYAKNIKLGTIQVKKVYLGRILIWPQSGDAYLNIVPEFIWLTKGNNYTEDINVFSNVEWNVK